jgi:molecular chaperone DnaJ
VADIFNAFFGASGGLGDLFGGGRTSVGPMQGGDIAATADIDLAQAARGTTVEVTYEVVAPCSHCHGTGAEPGTPIETCSTCGGSGQLRAVSRTPFGQIMRATVCDACQGEGKVARNPCRECRGRGRKVERVNVSVDVPAGIADGQRMRIAGRGHAGERGGPPGDLYVLVRVREDSRFVRDGNDLVTVVDVSAPLAALGTVVEVPTLEGPVDVEIPPGTQPHETLKVRGAGMPSLRGRGRSGDLRVVVNVVVPRHLDREQRELYERLADSMTSHNLHSDEGVFGKLKRAFGG